MRTAAVGYCPADVGRARLDIRRLSYIVDNRFNTSAVGKQRQAFRIERIELPECAARRSVGVLGRPRLMPSASMVDQSVMGSHGLECGTSRSCDEQTENMGGVHAQLGPEPDG